MRSARVLRAGPNPALLRPSPRSQVVLNDPIALPDDQVSVRPQVEGILVTVVNAANSLYDAVQAEAMTALWVHGEELALTERFWIHGQCVQMVRTLSREPVGWTTKTTQTRCQAK